MMKSTFKIGMVNYMRSTSDIVCADQLMDGVHESGSQCMNSVDIFICRAMAVYSTGEGKIKIFTDKHTHIHS